MNKFADSISIKKTSKKLGPEPTLLNHVKPCSTKKDDVPHKLLITETLHVGYIRGALPYMSKMNNLFFMNVCW